MVKPQSSQENLDQKISRISKSRRNIVLYSENPKLRNIIGEKFCNGEYNFESTNYSNFGDRDISDFHLYDITQLEDYQLMGEHIISMREGFPDAGLAIINDNQTYSRPRFSPLKELATRYTVPLYDITNLNVAGKEKNIDKIANSIFKNIDVYLTQPRLIKVGGSLFDLFETSPDVILNLMDKLKGLFNEGHHMILTTGGGPRNDAEKAISGSYGISSDPAQILKRQAETIVDILGDDVAEYISPTKLKNYAGGTDILFDHSYLDQKIPVTSLSASKNISPMESDTHTLEIGDTLGLYKVVFAKDTDGVFQRDPYKQPRNKRGVWPFQKSNEGENKFFPSIYARQVLNGMIDRTDVNGNGEHLIETGAMWYLINETKNLRAVQVINGGKPELLEQAILGNRYISGTKNYVGSFILKG